jgi:hypothetical protein
MRQLQKLKIMPDNTQRKLDEYKVALTRCTGSQCESVFQRVAESFEDDLLEFEDFPEDYFSFALELLSNATFYLKPGLWSFLMVLGTERHKLTSRHYDELAERMVEGYSRYSNEDLCLAVCDFIARNYSAAVARSLFGKLDAIEKNKSMDLRGFVADGLRILAAEEKRVLSDKH